MKFLLLTISWLVKFSSIRFSSVSRTALNDGGTSRSVAQGVILKSSSLDSG